MKNILLKSFLSLFFVINLAFYYGIESAFLIVSDAFYSFTKIDVMCIILGVIFVILFVTFIIYFIKKREKDPCVVTVEFNSPNDMTPTEVGFLVDGVMDGSDISGLIVYWASKKYLNIVNIKGSKEQKLIKIVKELPETANSYEKVMFQRMFLNDKEVLVSKISERFQDGLLVSSVERNVREKVGKQYFDSNGIWFRQIFICLFAFFYYITTMYFRLEYFIDVVPIVEIFSIASTCLYILCADWFLTYYDYRHKNNTFKGRLLSRIGFVGLMVLMISLSIYFYHTDLYQVFFLIGVIVLMFLVVFISRKFQIYSKEGNRRLGQILGFKEFIEVAEADRIKALVEENPNLFYEVLPYAFVLGVSDKWIKQFDVIRVKYPELVAEDVAVNMAITTHWMRVSNVSIIRAARYTKLAKVASVPLSFGSNGGSGKNVGGSNFGGFRRR